MSDPVLADEDTPLDPAVVTSLHALADSVDAGDVLLRELVEVFLADIGSKLADVEGTIRDGDAARTVALAHGLTGSSSSVGAHLVARHCRTLEGHARAARLPECAAVWSSLVVAVEDARCALRAAFFDDEPTATA